jgi:hypothetical protein
MMAGACSSRYVLPVQVAALQQRLEEQQVPVLPTGKTNPMSAPDKENATPSRLNAAPATKGPPKLAELRSRIAPFQQRPEEEQVPVHPSRLQPRSHLDRMWLAAAGMALLCRRCRWLAWPISHLTLCA